MNLNLSADDIADLMNRHRQELLRFLLVKVNCSDTAQDLFQETFIRYANYREKDKVENPRAFIFRIAANLATDHLRSRSRQMLTNADDGEAIAQLQAPAGELEHAAISRQQMDLLIEALAELPPKCRDVFIMLKLKHYSYAQVEQQLGISQTMILKYLTRALSHCRQRLER